MNEKFAARAEKFKDDEIPAAWRSSPRWWVGQGSVVLQTG